jgi:hypothetical protein
MMAENSVTCVVMGMLDAILQAIEKEQAMKHLTQQQD